MGADLSPTTPVVYRGVCGRTGRGVRVRCSLASGGLVEAIDEPGYRGGKRGGSASHGGAQPSIEDERIAAAWRQLAVGNEVVYEVVHQGRSATRRRASRWFQSACVAGRDRLY
jgi:hypothetical protein